MLNTHLFWHIIECISTIIELSIFKYILDNFSSHKRSEFTRNVSFTINIALALYMNIIHITPNFKLLILIITNYIFYIYNYESDIFKGLVINLAYWMLLVGIDFINVYILLALYSKSNFIELLKNDEIRLEGIIITKLLLLLLIPIVSNSSKELKLKKRQIITIIIPIVANILSIIIIMTLSIPYTNKSYKFKIILLIISIIIVLANISLIKIISTIVDRNNMEIENQIVKEKMSMQYQRYHDIQESQMKVRKLYHDMSNHISCIENLYRNNEDAKTYIKEIKNELSSSESMIYTNSMILDTIVNDKKKVCEVNNISFDVNINFSKCEFIEMIDVCSIFANMIDNSIEACIKIDDYKNRFIKINGNMVNNIFVVKCENSKVNSINLRKSKISTDKKDKFSHGLGIKNIESCVKKYDGEVAVDFSQDKFKMQIYIPLR